MGTVAKLDKSAFTASRYDPVIGACYARLMAKGKMFNQAMTACMRKPLVLMNVLVALRSSGSRPSDLMPQSESRRGAVGKGGWTGASWLRLLREKAQPLPRSVGV